MTKPLSSTHDTEDDADHAERSPIRAAPPHPAGATNRPIIAAPQPGLLNREAAEVDIDVSDEADPVDTDAIDLAEPDVIDDAIDLAESEVIDERDEATVPTPPTRPVPRASEPPHPPGEPNFDDHPSLDELIFDTPSDLDEHAADTRTSLDEHAADAAPDLGELSGEAEIDAATLDGPTDHTFEEAVSAPMPDAGWDPPTSAFDEEPATAERTGLAARATTPALGRLELRQIAGLTSGITMELDVDRYDFSDGDGDEDSVGFQIEVDGNDRAVVIPGSAATKLDTIPVTAPAVIGSGALDVGSARFLVRHRRERKRATDWLDQHDSVDRPEPLIAVPPDLDREAARADASKRRFGRSKPSKRKESKRKAAKRAASREVLDPVSWELVERVRAVRIEMTDRERYLHPDPAELAERATHRAPILGIRPPGHPLFAKVGVLVADMPWMPRFDDISAIPDSLGQHLKPLMSLPSQPIAADLMVGPLGIVGTRSATVACARHILLSLFGLSTSDLELHLAIDQGSEQAWEWAFDLAPARGVDLESKFPVVIVDGIENFEASGLEHADAIEHRAGVVILAESVEELPSYCGTVLQVDRAGSGLLTNHLGHIIAGTPIGVTTAFASAVADDLHALMERRNSR